MRRDERKIIGKREEIRGMVRVIEFSEEEEEKKDSRKKGGKRGREGGWEEGKKGDNDIG